jgi:hypothetical protein
MTYVPPPTDQAVSPRGRPAARTAARVLALALAALPLSAGLGVTTAHADTQLAAGCRGVTEKAIPPQGVVMNAAGTQGGHLWWRNTDDGVCVGTVIEDVQVTAATPTLTLRVVVFDAADTGGLTVATQQIAAGPGPVTLAFGIHQVFPGLREVCLAATSPVVTSPDLPCANFGRLVPVQQFTQPDTGMQPFVWP